MKYLKLEIKVSDGLAVALSKDLTHMQSRVGSLSWVKLNVNGENLVDWEVTDVEDDPS